MAERFERAFYRLEYPLTARPTLRVGDRSFEVLDLCEEGVRFLLRPGDRVAVGYGFEGAIRLLSGDVVPVEGKVLRVVGPQAAAKLLRGVSFGAMLEEQRLIQQRFLTRR
ncbi:MAG: hypothetical protein R2909_20635 [Gemmatimonadales bacterium]